MAERPDSEARLFDDATAGAGGEAPDSLPRRKLTDLVSPQLLQMLADSADGFRFAEDPQLAVEAMTTGQIKTGYTRKDTKTIYVNPLLIQGSPELGIKPWEARDARGFTAHEAGHHAPHVLALDEKLQQLLDDPSLVPEGFRGNPEAEKKFAGALYRHLVNGTVDIWLESYMGRYPYALVEDDIAGFQAAKGENESYTSMPKPDQLMQILLRSRYIQQKPLDGRVDPDVLEAYERIQSGSMMKTLMDRRMFEKNNFPSAADQKRSLSKKDQAIRAVLLPEYLKLYVAELDKRAKEESEQGGDGQPQDQEDGDEPGGDGAGEGKPKPGGGKPGQAPYNLTPEQAAKLLEQLAEELEKAGQEFASAAPEQETEQKLQQRLQNIKQAAEAREKKLPPKQTEQQPKNENNEDPMAALRKTMKNLQRDADRQHQLEMAEAHGVDIADVHEWERITTEHHPEINTLASSLSEVFLHDRRMRIEYLRKQGEIVPGLEYETIAALMSGKSDPETMMEMVKNKEFLETEIEFIGDVSGSMYGDKSEKSTEMVVVLVEALRQIRELLEAEGLLGDDEQPLRVGATKFSDTAERITTLDEPLSRTKELKIISHFRANGGGTDERQAIESVYEGLRLRQHNVLKLMVLFTDGQGSGAALSPILQKIESDPEVVMLVLGLGDDQASAEAIASTYVDPLRQGGERNIFAEAVPDSKDALPKLITFLRREIGKRQPEHH